MTAAKNYAHKIAVFESTTRILRWSSIAVVLLTFPLHLPQTPWVYGLIGLAVLYNLGRYLPVVQRSRVLRSPVGMLVIDTVFVGVLLALTGDFASPYRAFFVFMILVAAYLYALRGVLLVVALQGAVLILAATHLAAEPAALGNIRTIFVLVYALLAFGYLVVRMTGGERLERQKLKNLQHQSDQERGRLLTLLNSLNTAVFLTDVKGKIIHANEAARILSGTEGELVGASFRTVMPLHPRTGYRDKAVDILEEKGSAQHRRDLCIVRDDGETDLDISVTPVQHDAEGEVLEYIVACEDITTERSLDEQRSEFISVASHELRTPLAILEAALETALVPKNTFTPEVRTLLEQAYRNARYLAGIIKDITVLAEAQNDSLPIRITQVHAEGMLENLARDFAAQAAQKNITLQPDIAPGTPPVLSTEQYIREILQNYITNAIKYSDKGTITLAAEPARNGGILFSVQDQGIGISPKDQKLLFTKFFRAEDFRTRSTGGTGLGLYLCMEIAQRMGAKLWCKSRPGKGSTFFLEVPPFSNLKGDGSDVVKAQVENLIDGF